MPIRTPFLVLSAVAVMAATDAPRPVRTQTVAMVSAGQSLTLSGTVQARTLADLAFRVAGKVVQRPVEIGDHVRAGQVLARLDPADLLLSDQAAGAALQAAQADAANARTDLARYDGLGRTSPAYLPSEYDRRVAASRMAAARLVQAERQASLAHDQSGYGALLADADGVLTALPVQVGQVVTAGQTVATLAHTAETEIVVDVPENRLAAIRPATPVEIGLWAAPGQTLNGTVREIGAMADPAARTFTVKIAVRNAPPGLLALGMTASVRFGTDGPAVAVLPATALADQAGRPAVWVLDPAAHRAKLRPVQVGGYTGDGRVIVAAGLVAGDQVVTAGTGQIEPDMPLIAWAGANR
jgi:multidrug efflux system membrane fusion protein